MKLSKPHLLQYASVPGSTISMLTSEAGWSLELKPELGGVLASHPRDQQTVWIPFTNCRNGYPLVEAAPLKAAK